VTATPPDDPGTPEESEGPDRGSPAGAASAGTGSAGTAIEDMEPGPDRPAELPRSASLTPTERVVPTWTDPSAR